MFNFTPGGTKIVYTRDYLMSLKHSPASLVSKLENSLSLPLTRHHQRAWPVFQELPCPFHHSLKTIKHHKVNRMIKKVNRTE